MSRIAALLELKHREEYHSKMFIIFFFPLYTACSHAYTIRGFLSFLDHEENKKADQNNGEEFTIVSLSPGNKQQYD